MGSKRRNEDLYSHINAEGVTPQGNPIVPDDICRYDSPGPFGLVIFGASGDLTRRKLVPALYRLLVQGLLPEDFFVLGVSDARWSDNEFRQSMREAADEEIGALVPEAWENLVSRLHYMHGMFHSPDTYRGIKSRIEELERRHDTGGNRMFYLAIPPTVFEPVIKGLEEVGLQQEYAGFSRIAVEKPFGRDLDSAVRLNETLRAAFRETQIYRMDHYLAKETVQNILMFRFANSIFEPVWNNRFIDHVQISVMETLGVEHRAGYYEQSGVLRDMFQNHIFQLLSLTAMEPPSEFDADLVRDEKVKVFRAVRSFKPSDVVLGQYGEGTLEGKTVPAYRDEPGVAPGSLTPTYAAMKVFVDNWRWHGVPFYLRCGKRLSARKAEIAIHFKSLPHIMFRKSIEGPIMNNTLVMRVQPDDGINLLFQTKSPGSKICLTPVLMDFTYPKGFSLSGYERVLLDCLQGDQMLFVREDGVIKNWELFSPLIETLEGQPPHIYPAGAEGPREALSLMHNDGRVWRRP